MLDFRTVQRIREKINISEETIEKDYLVELLLSYFAQSEYLSGHLAFRGGTALKKIYFPDYRYSEDLDFITASQGILSAVKDKWEAMLKQIVGDFPIQLSQQVEYPQRGHLQIFVSYEILTEVRADKRLKVDIVEDTFVPPCQKAKLVFSFNDFGPIIRHVQAYTPESIAAEKIGRILDSVIEPRDLWDLLHLLNSGLKIRALKKIFHGKYSCDISLPRLLSAIKSPAYERTWHSRLENQVPNLPPYEKATADLVASLKNKLQ
ncbi:MAG: nucleotidyl transferase AbiEii/AbiGii toxin family protein [Elusimicrobia bacterium]|nr:nucleotidyl transferase AbiEii/AbiGii toxin family protein [Elusimicrobiota bacterium]